MAFHSGPPSAVLEATPPRVVQTINSSVKARFQDCCAIALKKIQDNPDDVSAWKLLFLIPRMLLRPMVRGGKNGLRDVKLAYEKFLSWQWEDLVKLQGLPTKRASYGNEEARIAAALRLVRCGELSRASKVLTSTGLAESSAETTAKLALKHPRRSTTIIREATPHHESINLTRSILFDVIRRSPRGSGTGPSGWRFEHLKVLIENDFTADCLFSACTAIAHGILPEIATKLLSSSRLIAIPKPNGDVRPIAIGECIRRVTSRAICVQMKNSFASFFCPIQHGVSTENGSELIIHHIELMLEHNPDWIVLKSDVKNAFNSINRHHLLNELRQSFPELYNYASQMYGGFNSLVFMEGGTAVAISSEEGIHQGDPLGPALFATAIHPILRDLQERFQEIHILAYLDDVFLLGHPDKTLEAFQNLKDMFLSGSLSVSDSKCEIFSPSGTINTANTYVQVTSEGSMFLGTPIGSTAFVESSCSQIVQSGSSLCDYLPKLNDPQSALLLLRHCHVPKLDHLARTVHPNNIRKAASIHDSMTRATFSQVLGFPELVLPWEQISLPVRLGGFGMSSLSSTFKLGYVASWIHSLAELPLRFPAVIPMVDNVVDHQFGSVGDALAKSIPPDKLLSDYLANPKKLQSRLSNQFFADQLQLSLNNSATARDASRLYSLQGKGAGAWLNAIPATQGFAFKPCDFRLASLVRLGLPISLSHWSEACNCSAPLDDSGYHLLTCKTGGGPIWSHESIAGVWSECLRSLQIHHRREPRNRYVTSDCRPDIVMFDSESASNLDLDISLAHPWSADAFPSSADRTGVAAKQRENRKAAKYSQQKLPGTSVLKAIPLVFEHFGAWGEEAKNFLRKLAAFSSDEVGQPNAPEFVDFWRKRFSVQLQKCNARVIQKKLNVLCGGCQIPESLSTQFFYH